MECTVRIDAGEVVGIGKIKLFASENTPELPTLSFVVAKCDDGTFVASCMQLLLDAHASTDTEAVNRLENSCMEFIQMFFNKRMDEDSVWLELAEIFSSSVADGYWSAYRKMQIALASKGISTSSKPALEHKIKELQNQLAEYTDKKLKVKVVSYQRKAA